MKKVGDLMRELGFKEDGPDEVKKAFIMNLFKAAYPHATPPELGTTASPLKKAQPKEEQLSFDFESAAQSTELRLSPAVRTAG